MRARFECMKKRHHRVLHLGDAGLLGGHVARAFEDDHLLVAGEALEEAAAHGDVGHAVLAGVHKQDGADLELLGLHRRNRAHQRT